jgi:hypothetical protein
MDAAPPTVKAKADRQAGQEAFTPPARWVYVFGALTAVALVGFVILKLTVFSGM